jgi:hypothetical protein
MNKYGVGILAAVMIAALVMPAVAAGQATVDRTSFFSPQYNNVRGYVHDSNSGAPVENATVVLVFYGYWTADVPSNQIDIATTTTDMYGYYDFGNNIWGYQYSPALLFAYALGCEPSSPEIILLLSYDSPFYYNLWVYNSTYLAGMIIP